MNAATLQTTQDHLTRVHEIGVEVGSSKLVGMTATTIEDLSGVTIIPPESQIPLSVPTTVDAASAEISRSLSEPWFMRVGPILRFLLLRHQDLVTSVPMYVFIPYFCSIYVHWGQCIVFTWWQGCTTMEDFCCHIVPLDALSWQNQYVQAFFVFVSYLCYVLFLLN